MSETDTPEGLKRTPLTGRHRSLDAKMAAFAGYDMPIQYPMGILGEHLHTRQHAGLFDVSHMGQAYLMGSNAAKALEALVPGDIQGLAIGQMRYTLLLNDKGGIEDDLMVLRLAPDLLFLVVNASRKDADYAMLRRSLPRDVTLEVLGERVLVALQGPSAAPVLEKIFPETAKLTFMQGYKTGDSVIITRSGYAGEDGFEISLPVDEDLSLITQLTQHDEVKWIGLGARDSLRLEAGLCLYGHELDETTSPIEADLKWVIPKVRRESLNFPGGARIGEELKNGPSRLRVGIKPQGRAIAREQTVIQQNGEAVGIVTSGGFGPSVGGPVAMGYVPAALAKPGTVIDLLIRGTPHPAEIVALPFVPHTYRK